MEQCEYTYVIFDWEYILSMEYIFSIECILSNEATDYQSNEYILSIES